MDERSLNAAVRDICVRTHTRDAIRIDGTTTNMRSDDAYVIECIEWTQMDESVTLKGNLGSRIWQDINQNFDELAYPYFSLALKKKIDVSRGHFFCYTGQVDLDWVDYRFCTGR